MNDTKKKHATHTPGPWHAWYCKENETGGGIFQNTNDDNQRMICRMAKEKRVIHKDKRKSDDFVHSAEDEANARLIAAAPEMYEKLCEICNVIIALEEKGVNLPYHYFKDDMSMSDKLREVLAKVIGGEG